MNEESHSSEKMLTKSELCAVAGISTRELYRREALGQITPAKKISSRGSNKGPLCFYTMKQAIEQRERTHKKSASTVSSHGTNYSREDCQLAFKAIKSGKTLNDIVVDHGIHPLALKQIADEYANLGEYIFVSRQALKRLEKLPLAGTWPVKTGDELVEVLEQTIQIEAMCSECDKRLKAVCKACYGRVAKVAAEKEPA